MKLWRLLAQYIVATTTYTAVTGVPASPYVPDFDGKLIGLRVVPGRMAANSLIDQVQFRLTCTTFTPNSIECGCLGSGLQTAPAFVPAPFDFEMEMPVKAGVPITIEGRNVTSGTPVTPNIMVWGLFTT